VQGSVGLSGCVKRRAEPCVLLGGKVKEHFGGGNYLQLSSLGGLGGFMSVLEGIWFQS